MSTDRYRVKVEHRHTPVEADLGGEYHEWVEAYGGFDDSQQYLDRIGRRNASGAGYRWDKWVCNNTDCHAVAWVSATALEETAQGWLNVAGGERP